MSSPEDQEPPQYVWYDLEEALALLATLEDARDALLHSWYLVVMIEIEHEIRVLTARLDFGPEGNGDDD